MFPEEKQLLQKAKLELKGLRNVYHVSGTVQPKLPIHGLLDVDL